MTTALTLHRIEGEPRVLDTDLAKRLGMERPTNIRAVIARNRKELEAFGPLHTARAMVAIGSGAQRGVRSFFLIEEQACLVVMLSRTPKAAGARREIIQVFTAWRRGEMEQAAPQPALPDFSNQVLMARAWADQLEATLLAQRHSSRQKLRNGMAVFHDTPIA